MPINRMDINYGMSFELSWFLLFQALLCENFQNQILDKEWLFSPPPQYFLNRVTEL